MTEGMRERERMKQVREFWLPAIDLRWWSHWGKTRGKTLVRCRPFVLFEDKPGEAERNGQVGEARGILLSLGAHRMGRIGVRGNDWLYGFDEVQVSPL